MAATSAALALAISLLVAGCGGPAWSASFEIGSANASTRLSVTAWRGKVSLRNSATGRVEVTLRGEAPLPLDRALIVDEGGGGPLLGLRIDEAAKDADLVLEIAAPPGVSLHCSCAGADVLVSGTWGKLWVTTGGTIGARVDSAASGVLMSRKGDVAFAALRSGPTGEIKAESTSGDVSVSLPAQWSGQVQFRTRSGRLDVPPHESLRTIWDEDRKGVIGHLGPPREAGAPLAKVWGTSATGSVSFRVGE